MIRTLSFLLLTIATLAHESDIFGQESLGLSEPLSRKLEELQEKAQSFAAREIPFQEKRFFPFRKTPTVVEGIVRIWRGVGTSIAYPASKTVVIHDEEGILLRRISEDGSYRERASKVGWSNAIELLGSAFNFDQRELNQAFELNWEEGDGNWKILMEPREAEGGNLESVTINGNGTNVESIVMGFLDRKRIEIFPEEEIARPTFSEEEQAMYFRQSKG